MPLPPAEIDLTTQTLRDVFTLTVPEAFLLALACVVYLGGTVRAGRHLWGAVTLGGLAIAFGLFWTRVPPPRFDQMVSPLLTDEFADIIRLITYAGAAMLLLLFWNEVNDEHAADFHACLLVLVAGLSLVGAANDLITMFLALELISIPTYILLYLPHAGARPQEAAIKYFLLSIFTSALLLFGFSYLYGVRGTTNITQLFQSLGSDGTSGLTAVAVVMVVAGLGFRITAVPFHFYAPDVFQGAPTSVAAMLAFVPKVAGFAALARLLGFLSGSTGLIADSQLALLFWLLAAITMTVGNILALLQDNLKRLLAYSSIAHGGYVLVGLAAAPHLRGSGPRGAHGVEAVFFYMIAYGAMTIGAFAVLHYLRSQEREPERVDDLAGIGRTHPLPAAALMLFLFSLIGLPLTAGFTGKFLLFMNVLAVEDYLPAGNKGLFIALAVIGVLNAAASAYYYLRIIATMYLRDAVRPLRPAAATPALVAIAACAVVTIVLGIFPTPVVQAIKNAVVTNAPARLIHMR